MIEHEETSFNSIADLCLDSTHSINAIAAAIELIGFYTWDKLGRFIYVSPDKDAHKKLCGDLVDHLSEACKGGYEFDEDYFDTPSQGLINLKRCGWIASDLPDFEKLRIEWDHKNLGKKTKSLPLKSLEESQPATQSKVWDVVAGLIELKFKKEVLEDLKKEKSMEANMVCIQLATVGINIDPKTLKKYLKKT
jgi:hypothetical protein